jgi:NAD(P)-dependent dehydrogenase (short-subunit alcohol dehydrogenase family)
MNALVKKALELGGTFATAAVFTRAVLRSLRWFSYEGKIALVTGGSRGLGLELARRLVDAGARVAICARDEEELQAAESDLEGRGGDVLATVCDVRNQSQVNSMINQVEEHFGRLDILINNAGVIEVGPLDSMTLDDFREAMETHFWGPLYTTLAAMPGMRRRRWGRIVNIASIGGKRAVPHLVPYCASKFALVGLSNALRTELAQDGILVTVVCPSLMRTGSPRNATFKGRHRREYAWFAISDALPLVSLDSSKAAARILRACQRGDAEAMIGGPANLLKLVPIADADLTEILSIVNRLLPSMGGIGQARAKGFESESAAAPSILTRASDRAALRNNEIR